MKTLFVHTTCRESDRKKDVHECGVSLYFSLVIRHEFSAHLHASKVFTKHYRNHVHVHIIRQLERLQRQSARVVCKKYKNDHTSVTELMSALHWLPIRALIQYKILLLVYKVFTNASPTYLADMMTSCNPVRSTRSSYKVNLLVVQPCHIKNQIDTLRKHLQLSDLVYGTNY